MCWRQRRGNVIYQVCSQFSTDRVSCGDCIIRCVRDGAQDRDLVASQAGTIGQMSGNGKAEPASEDRIRFYAEVRVPKNIDPDLKKKLVKMQGYQAITRNERSFAWLLFVLEGKEMFADFYNAIPWHMKVCFEKISGDEDD